MVVTQQDLGPGYAELSERFAPVFEEIAAGAAQRENERELPFQAVKQLRDAGFTALTVPREFGGAGVSLSTWFRLAIDLAAADSNLLQLLRAHFIFVEGWVVAPVGAEPRGRLLSAVAEGAIVGTAFHERSRATVGHFATKLTRSGDDWVLNGVKHYTTGSLFADLITVTAEDEDGRVVSALVSAKEPGITVNDDWNGFGQRLTGSGSARFENVRVEPASVSAGKPDNKHIGPFVELVLQAAAAGVAQRIVTDTVEFVRNRTRVYSQGAGALPRHDPQVQEALGRVSAKAFAARASVLAAADALSVARATLVAGGDASASLEQAWLTSEQAQIVVADLVLSAATDLFEVGGASATDQALRLDRHWRNARTLASHNPRMYRARQVGDHLLNGESLAIQWATGEFSGEQK